MSLVFDHTVLPQRVLFGSGRAADFLEAEVDRLNAHRVMIIASERENVSAQHLSTNIDVAVRHHDRAPHVPVENAKRARAVAADNDADLLVSIGGGSTTGLAKAVALTTGIPIIAIPTTYAGSEATNVWGITEAHLKTTGVDNKVLPVSIIYDAELTLTLPPGLAIASGLNAMAHCIDSLWAPRADPINQALAVEGTRILAEALTAVAADPNALSAHEQMLYGAYLSATAFSSAGSGLHHKICHVLGGAYNLPHAHTHSAVLRHVVAFNAPAAPAAETRLAAALASGSATAGLDSLLDRVNAPHRLADYGFREEDISAAAGLILPVVPVSNPRRVRHDDLITLLSAAYSGETTPLERNSA